MSERFAQEVVGARLEARVALVRARGAQSRCAIPDEHGDSRSDVVPGTGAVDEAVVGIVLTAVLVVIPLRRVRYGLWLSAVVLVGQSVIRSLRPL
jgi:hypothetical protein